jgi:hypothetical protein
MAMNETPRVVIYDDIPTPYRDQAALVAQGAGWIPQEFEEVYAAQRRIGLGGIGAVISALGSREAGVRLGFSYPAEPLVRQAGRLGIPVALVSDKRNAQHYIDKAPGSSIVVPKQPEERFTPILRTWFASLVAEQG